MSPQLDMLEGERGMPSVSDQKVIRWRGILMIPFMLTGILITAGLAYLSYVGSQEQVENVTPKNLQISKSVPDRIFKFAQEVEEKVLSNEDKHNQVQNSVPIRQRPFELDDIKFRLDKSGSALMITQDNNTQQKAEQFILPGVDSGSQQHGGLNGLLNATPTTLHTAKLLHDRNYLLAKGSFIDCVLQTKLDSTVPGMTSCVVTRNIYSDTGKIVLIERGSTISGEYQSNMRQDQARIFILWNRIKTPNGVVINLDSPGTDSLGGSGISGYVNNHFWQRFGGAILLSFIQDLGSVMSNQLDSNKTAITFNNSSDATQSLAAETLRHTINILPTLYKNHGERVGIYIARDLDFKNVYDLKPE